MLQFEEVKIEDDLSLNNIFNILKETGQHMYETEGLTHWLKPYTIKNIKEDLKYKSIFLVTEQKEILATFALSKIKSKFFKDEEKFIYLSKFAVSPNQSNKGLGSKCLDFIENLVQEQDFIGIRLDVYEKSIPAINFYKKKGFLITSTESTKNYTVLCMEKRV